METKTKFWGQKTKSEKYLEFVNDWLTIDAIAENYGMTNADMINLLNEGKIEHLENICASQKQKLESYAKDCGKMGDIVVKLQAEKAELLNALNEIISGLNTENRIVLDLLKEDTGKLNMEKDPIQAMSFYRGKNAAYCIAIDRIKATITKHSNT